MAQTKREIQTLFANAGVRPLKRFGQHFLIDGNLMRKLVAAARLRSDDVVLEVGPGTGSLTEELLRVCGHVVAVEIDRTLQTLCWARMGSIPHFTLIAGDVLERKSAISAGVGRELQARQTELGGRILLVANLPYQVATPLIIDLLVSVMCFTVQAEVADRLLANPDCKSYGPVSVFAQALADVERIARVPPAAFWPAPRVDSAMLRLSVRPESALPAAVQRTLTELVHGCFQHRRKTMKSNLRTLLDQAVLAHVERDGRWDLSVRPECISVTQWVALAGFLTECHWRPG